ncbi:MULTISPECIES: L-rhamnose mutarotase [unclassified Microbacterium]|uniref:L-rhamnose mutarotase n=1 Tax=unclassified Microbacterium TaxID=2609290 RepID=UPI0016052159|nr:MULTISPECIES: L-rhamnose mutarotase [unclassified Microbacterium]QNA93547.1 L-rhamnose mutarotase [Microbacterium sp. Se63.02b]QYM63800.1 L-rhamnose mutarotase [Microbacterium sp. Se5.02b]
MSAAASPTIQRVCFTMRLRPSRVDDYLRDHAEVWPEMLAALTEAGWTNYSLFIRRDEGIVIGYLETEDFARAQSEVARREVNTRWQASMAPYFERGRPDGALDVWEEYFHLD